MWNKYNPQERESYWQKFWEDNWVYKFDPQSSKPIYSIDTPPPTVSWKIHVWHIFSYTQAEVIWRYQRMLGKNVFYPFGFDDNWLPTERLVEKDTGKKPTDIWRQAFSDLCLEVTEKYRDQFKNLWKSIWLSVDWNLAYSTVSKEVQKISQTSFLKLFEKWIIYRKLFPALRCHECKTCVAQAEVEDKEFDSVFYDQVFTLEDWSEVIVATTRPELLPGCVAVFVNPKDERYTNLVWKKIYTPIGVQVDILADEKVAIDKWSWVVMCCTYWDETDMYWVQKHNLSERIILDEHGHLRNSWVEGMDWLFLKKGREFIVQKLKAEWKIRSEKPITHAVWVHERCSTPMEFIPISQWFIKILDRKQDMLTLADKINWYPEYMRKRYIDWVENLKWDWCISRQRYFGIPIPVWYSKKTWEMILADVDQLPVDPLKSKPMNLPQWHTYDDIEAEEDVLDTWATSSLTPLINVKWEQDWSIEDMLMPMSLRPQAHDIIRTWALYTIIMSMFHRNDIPFKDIMISWHVLAGKWEKISKSKGNAKHSPEELIKIYWADPIRYWACWWWLGKNIVFDEEEIKNWLRLVTKLWNASNFVFMNLSDFDPNTSIKADDMELLDLWILKRVEELSRIMKKNLDGYEFSPARMEFEKFFWSEFCDNYLEIVKDIIYKPENYKNGDRKKLSSQFALYHSLLGILKLISPIIPHITEEIYQSNYKDHVGIISIHNTLLPDVMIEWWNFEYLNTETKKLFEIVDMMRKFKSDNNIKLGQQVMKIIISWSSDQINDLKKYSDNIMAVTKAKEIVFLEWDSLGCELLV